MKKAIVSAVLSALNIITFSHCAELEKMQKRTSKSGITPTVNDIDIVFLLSDKYFKLSILAENHKKQMQN